MRKYLQYFLLENVYKILYNNISTNQNFQNILQKFSYYAHRTFQNVCMIFNRKNKKNFDFFIKNNCRDFLIDFFLNCVDIFLEKILQKIRRNIYNISYQKMFTKFTEFYIQGNFRIFFIRKLLKDFLYANL